MIPELIFAVLACARIGAVHSVIFAGFSSESIRDRVEDCQARMIITADGGYRRGKILELKKIVDEGVSHCSSISEVLVIKRGGELMIDCPMTEGRFYYDVISADCSSVCPPEEMDSEDLYSYFIQVDWGKPKGIMHTTAGYQVFSYITSKYVFDLNDEDVH